MNSTETIELTNIQIEYYEPISEEIECLKEDWFCPLKIRLPKRPFLSLRLNRSKLSCKNVPP